MSYEPKPFNPLADRKHYDLDWTSGTIRVIQDGSNAVILLVTKTGEQIVLNIVEYNGN